jgi:GNAT superfamily N-acetyltransferase
VRPKIVVHQAGPDEAERVGKLACDLLSELYPDTQYDREFFIDAAKALIGKSEGVWALLATANDARDVGLVTLNECAAIYSGEHFGEISELYVVPDYRSKSVGALLIEAAISFGRERGWPNIEVGAPSPSAWQRTVDFYLRHGFEELGPRLDLELGGGSGS